MYKKILIPIIFTFVCSCSSEKNYKEGKFELYVEEGKPMVVERNGKYQFEYSEDGSIQELFLIQWKGDSLYLLETVHKEDTIDSNDLIVKIDSVVNDTSYLKSYMKSIDFTVTSKMIKIDNNLSNKFKEILKRETAH